MKILIFTCLCQRATHCLNVALHPLQMLLVLSPAHNEGKDVFLQLEARHKITLLSGGKEQKDRATSTRQQRVNSIVFIGHVFHCLNRLIRCMHFKYPGNLRVRAQC